MRRTIPFAVLIIIGILMVASVYRPDSRTATSINQKPEPIPDPISTITLVAVGDSLMHNTQIWSGKQSDGSYKFDTFFREVKPLIEAGDYSSTCFEAPMAGPDTDYTGYPLFNSPDAAADAFKAAGFDMLVTANNHMLDRGYRGAIRTLKVIEASGLDTLGAYQTDEASRNFLIKDLKGIRVGYLGYTYGTNGLPIPEEHPYLINLLDRDRILEDITSLKPQVDVLVLVLHWGAEYSPSPTMEQQNLAREFCAAGADVILGSHPHVIQTMEVIPQGNRNCFVIYSMGNFISHQRGLERNSGIILQIKYSKDFNTGRTVLDKVEYIPTFSHSYSERGKMYFRVVPVQDTINKIESDQEPYLTRKDLPVLRTVLDHTRKQLGEPYYGQQL